MRRALVAWILVFSTGLSGCAARRDAAVVSAPEPASAVQARLDGYPSGTRMRLGLAGGERVEGVLLWADADSVSLETAPGAPPRVIARTSIVEASTPTTVEHQVRTASSWAMTAVVTAVAILGGAAMLAFLGSGK